MNLMLIHLTRSTVSTTLALSAIAICLTLACSDTVEGPSNGDPWNFEEHYPAIVAPDDLHLGDVAFGEEASKTFVVENNGHVDLEIRTSTVDAPFELSTSSPDESLVVEPHATTQFEVRLPPEAFDNVDSSTELSGHIELESNDPDNSDHEIEVTATLLVPCLEIDLDETYDFGEVPRDATSTKVVELRNCDGITVLFVEIDEVGGDSAFSSLFGGFTGTDGAVVAPGEPVELWLMFRPQTPEAKEGTVQLSTNAPAVEFSVDLFGQGNPYGCVKPVIEAEADQAQVSSDEHSVLNAPVLSTVTLDASSTYDPTPATLDSVQWSLIDAPTDSGALLEADPDSMTNELFLDLAGTYVVELNAVNDDGEWACTPARLIIEALIGSDVHVQLVWDTPGDPERHNDHGSDLDLHFLHPDGQWDEPPYDCNWQNPTPLWHDDHSYGNPTLDIDATQGWGPENVNLDDPAPHIDYAVGVYYFTDRGYGPSIATVRVFFEGFLHTELSSPAFETGQFWDALRLRWDPNEVDAVDLVYDDFP